MKPSASTWNRIAYNQARLGRPNDVFVSLETALRLDPQNATSFAYRGFARLALKDAKSAAADFYRAIELDGANATALEGLRRLSLPARR